MRAALTNKLGKPASTVIDFGYRHGIGGHGRSHVLARALSNAGYFVRDNTVCAYSRLKLARLLCFALTAKPADLILVRSPTSPALLKILGILHRRTGARLIYDAMLSAYETQVEDRQYHLPGSKRATTCRWEDIYVGQSASLLIVDTAPHAEYLAEKFKCSQQKMEVIPVGSPLVDSLSISALNIKERLRTSKHGVNVIYAGGYIPLHGVDLMIQAAIKVLATRNDVHFKFIGSGQDYAKAFAMANNTPGLTFVPPMNTDDIIHEYNNSDIVFGIFGRSEKAKRVIPFKAYDALALGKPLIMQNSQCSRAYLRHEENAMLVERNCDAIAYAIARLATYPKLRSLIGSNARSLYEATFSSSVTNKRFISRIHKLDRCQF